MKLVFQGAELGIIEVVVGGGSHLRESLGDVKAVVQTGHVVVKPVDASIVRKLKIGFKVYRDGEAVGWVSDVIGNVSNPYVVVRVKDRGVMEKLPEGARLYVELPPPRRPRRRPGKPRRGRGGPHRRGPSTREKGGARPPSRRLRGPERGGGGGREKRGMRRRV
ncbi:MAG: hypothetical protein F7B17_03005 [Desulfurococcales archaeon]|nr:hypothetical protein [Desulfurococcales archaeon]